MRTGPLADKPRLAPGVPGGTIPVRLVDDDLAGGDVEGTDEIEPGDLEVDDPSGGANTLVLGWGSTFGPIQAAARLVRAGAPAFRWVVVGDGPLLPALREQVAALGLEASGQGVSRRAAEQAAAAAMLQQLQNTQT